MRLFGRSSFSSFSLAFEAFSVFFSPKECSFYGRVPWERAGPLRWAWVSRSTWIFCSFFLARRGRGSFSRKSSFLCGRKLEKRSASGGPLGRSNIRQERSATTIDHLEMENAEAITRLRAAKPGGTEAMGARRGCSLFPNLPLITFSTKLCVKINDW